MTDAPALTLFHHIRGNQLIKQIKMASPEDHTAVVAMQKRGSSVSETSKTLKLHQEQVHRVISGFGETGGIENWPSGRPDELR
ncbi:hypothetical protein Y032_0112g326 [Ancylostoma ceylanicum]|uniref:Paired domain-containing protein n=1 Tax=Ancylostoma ceylanicum TaxID=53326 RepID=A0A016TD35_9BILA|nr:hypothetical protein Y032_0112g326 [Ancylostoma ceylanicum]